MTENPLNPPPALTRFDARFAADGLAREGWRGRITARFDHAAVAVSDEGAPERITLQHPRRGLVPWGLVWPGSWTPLREGAEVRLRNEVVVVEGGARARLDGEGVDLSVARLVTPGDRAWLAEQVRGITLPQRTRQLLGDDPLPDDSVASRILERARHRLARLVERLRDCAGEGALREAAQPLVGLGPGETPTGDDLLLGLLAGLWRLAALGHVAEETRDCFCRVLRELDTGTTTATARVMTQEGATGVFPEPLLRCCGWLGSVGVTTLALQAAVDAVASVGHQSGADWLAGVFALA